MKKILIADDMVTVQHNLSFVLQNYQYEIVAKVGNAPEAVLKCRELKPDVVLFDILGMTAYFEETKKDVDTFEAIKMITSENPNIKVIVLTATPKEEYIKKALLMGAKGFLVKGVSNDKLIFTIEDVLKKQ